MTAVTVLDGADELRAATGRHLGESSWTEITPAMWDDFAAATGGHHEHFVLALSNQLLPQILEVRGFAMGVNYGVDRVRYPAPIAVGSRIRATAELVAVDEVGAAVQTLVRITIELDGSDEPACVIDSLSRWMS
jgi:acyl dehydratase